MTSMSASHRTPRWTRRAYVIYAGVLATATHWPGITIHGPIERPDLVIHLIAFSIWTVLLGRSAFLGDPARPRVLLLIALVASAYAGLDEWTQRFVNRTSSWDDYLANLTGVAAGVLLLALIARWQPGK